MSSQNTEAPTILDDDDEGVQAIATIRDVARAANVSVSTVSHVLSGKRPTSVATRARVREAVAQLQYRPNAMAQSLVWRKSFALGLVIPDITNPYYPTLARCVEDRLWPHGYTLVLGNTDYNQEREIFFLDALRARQLGGLIVCLSETAGDMAEHLRRTRREGAPMVLIHSPLPGMTTVGVDNEAGGRLAAEHLLGLGHRQIGLITAAPADLSITERQAGFVQALVRAGAAASAESVPSATADHHLEGGRAAAAKLLASNPEITALFALSDLMAIGALEAARAAGRSVPGDLSVMGFDDVAFAAVTTPALTTVAQPAREIGEQAADLLLTLVEAHRARPAERQRPEPRSVVVQPRLVVRQSTGPVRKSR